VPRAGPHQVLGRHRALVGHALHGRDEVPHAEARVHLNPGVAVALALLVRGRARHVQQRVGVLACDAAHLRAGTAHGARSSRLGTPRRARASAHGHAGTPARLAKQRSPRGSLPLRHAPCHRDMRLCAPAPEPRARRQLRRHACMPGGGFDGRARLRVRVRATRAGRARVMVSRALISCVQSQYVWNICRRKSGALGHGASSRETSCAPSSQVRLSGQASV